MKEKSHLMTMKMTTILKDYQKMRVNSKMMMTKMKMVMKMVMKMMMKMMMMMKVQM
jgi:hypothetical protein